MASLWHHPCHDLAVPARAGKYSEGKNVNVLQHRTVQPVISLEVVFGSGRHLTQITNRGNHIMNFAVNPRLRRVPENLREEMRELEESGV